MSEACPSLRRLQPVLRGAVICFFGVAMALAGMPVAKSQPTPDASAAKAGGQAMKVPRYLSLKANRVLLRQGPGAEYPAAWVFRRTGLPVEIIDEMEVWRKVRDAGGAEGWVHSSLLSGRRTALVLPWEIKEGQAEAPAVTLRDDDSETAGPVARVEAGVLASIIACANGWCRVSVGRYRGYIQQGKLWGTYPNEEIKP